MDAKRAVQVRFGDGQVPSDAGAAVIAVAAPYVIGAADLNDRANSEERIGIGEQIDHACAWAALPEHDLSLPQTPGR